VGYLRDRTGAVAKENRVMFVLALAHEPMPLATLISEKVWIREGRCGACIPIQRDAAYPDFGPLPQRVRSFDHTYAPEINRSELILVTISFCYKYVHKVQLKG